MRLVIVATIFLAVVVGRAELCALARVSTVFISTFLVAVAKVGEKVHSAGVDFDRVSRRACCALACSYRRAPGSVERMTAVDDDDGDACCSAWGLCIF